MKNFRVTLMLSHMSTHEVEVRAKDEMDAMKQAQELGLQYELWKVADTQESFTVTDAAAVKVDE